MKIIISPAKKMNERLDTLAPKNLPHFLDRAEVLMSYLKKLSMGELQRLLCCNDKIAALNFERYQRMDLRKSLTPAILAYEGIQYQYMAPQVFDYEAFDYVEEHLRILSGFYGILRPFDGVTPYRLEMQAKLKTDFCSSLYQYWGSSIYQELTANHSVILNLASAEYSKIVSKYLAPETTMLTCQFGELVDGRLVEKGVHVKMARGEMVRFLADNRITDLEGIKRFDRLGYTFDEQRSTPERYVFIKAAAEISTHGKKHENATNGIE